MPVRSEPSWGVPWPKQPRLLHVTTVDMSLALLLRRHLESFVRAGYEVVAASAPGPWVPEIEAAGIRHIALQNATRAVAASKDLRFAAEVFGLIRRERPTIVHTHNPKPGIIGRVAARLLGVPVVVNTVHGLYAQPSDPLKRRLLVYGAERAAAACSDLELVQNAEDLETLRGLGVPKERLQLLGNGIDLSRFQPENVSDAERDRLRAELGFGDRDVVVGAVGRLVREKGYRELFSAYAEVRRRQPSTRLVVVGPHDPNKKDAVTPEEVRQAENMGVLFLGLRHDIERLYRIMDLYVLPSHREGFPRAAMEAAAMGKAVVATDIRGCRQVVDDGITGLLVPPRDARRLAQAMQEVVADPPLRARMGRAAQSKAHTEFDDRRQIATTLDAYGRLLRAPRTCRRRRAKW